MVPSSVHFLVDAVHLAILQPLLYFESFEVEGVGVHFHESLPHAMSTAEEMRWATVSEH